MKRLKVMRYVAQDTCTCAVAAAATASNYYDKNHDYITTKELVQKKISNKVEEEGMDSSQICILLNKLGFYKVTLITSISELIDYSWRDYSRKKMIDIMEESVIAKKDKDDKKSTKMALKWLKDFDYDNKIIISYDFGKYIRQHLNKKKPVILSFNWTMFQKFPKEGPSGDDPFNGDDLEHAVVANGYDDKGVWIVDSHHQCYKYTRKKYRRGFYKISWENLMTCMGQGDVYLPDDYASKG